MSAGTGRLSPLLALEVAVTAKQTNLNCKCRLRSTNDLTDCVAAGSKVATIYADKILRGVMPSELPVEQQTKFELVINMKTATALAVDVPPGD